MTNIEYAKQLFNRLTEKKILPQPDDRKENEKSISLSYNSYATSTSFLDYVSCGEWKADPTDLDPDKCFIEGYLNFGGSEGIYLDLSLRTEDTRSYPVGTIKTLLDDRLAMHAMASLLADILIEGNDLLFELYKVTNI